MKLLFFIFLLIATSMKPLITKEFIEMLKKTVKWEVTDYEENSFRGITFDETKDLLLPDQDIPPSSIGPETESPKRGSYPFEFDSRDKWPQCIHKIRNQGRCGASWAMSSTTSLSERYCILGKDVMLSPQELVSCNRYCHGCDGGYTDKGVLYLAEVGAVTEQCLPYVSGNTREVPECPSHCVPYGMNFHRYRCNTFRKIPSVDKIMNEMFWRGPVVSRIDVYQDFYAYKYGIYQHKAGGLVGGLGVKVLGYGIENGINFWICQNSWGPSWGQGGYFKIKEGDCRIDEFFFTCDPRI